MLDFIWLWPVKAPNVVGLIHQFGSCPCHDETQLSNVEHGQYLDGLLGYTRCCKLEYVGGVMDNVFIIVTYSQIFLGNIMLVQK